MPPRRSVRTHGTRSAACRVRVRDPTTSRSGTPCFVPRPAEHECSMGLPAPRAEARGGVPRCRTPFTRTSRTMRACKHAFLESLWARPSPARRASDGQEARRADLCDPPLPFSKTGTRVSCASGSILRVTEASRCFTGGQPLHGDHPGRRAQPSDAGLDGPLPNGCAESPTPLSPPRRSGPGKRTFAPARPSPLFSTSA